MQILTESASGLSFCWQSVYAQTDACMHECTLRNEACPGTHQLLGTPCNCCQVKTDIFCAELVGSQAGRYLCCHRLNPVLSQKNCKTRTP